MASKGFISTAGSRNGKSHMNHGTRSKPTACHKKFLWLILPAISFLFLLYSLTICGCPPEKLHTTEAIRGTDCGQQWSGDLRDLKGSWNRLRYGAAVKAPEKLRLALFVKKWPVGSEPGGMERHALTLHRALAARGHETHVYTAPADGISENSLEQEVPGLRVHLVKSSVGSFDFRKAWKMFVARNATQPFDAVHSESVGLAHWEAEGISNVAASWHGIQYEALHSDIFQDLARTPGEPRSEQFRARVSGLALGLSDEIRFFRKYEHHVATSDYTGEVLRSVYQLPPRNVHVILNGVDEAKFRPEPAIGAQFRAKIGVPPNASVVMGVAGRLVKDKGHPLLFEAFAQISKKYEGVYLVVAGSGPWEQRYRELEPRVKVLGSLDTWQLVAFYNSLDIFLNPTMRFQGLDQTNLEAILCGKPLLATNLPSIRGSIIVREEFGYTFSPSVASLIGALERAIEDGREEMKKKGEACRSYGSAIFTANKMALAYERLFLCIKNQTYCQYPLPGDCVF